MKFHWGMKALIELHFQHEALPCFIENVLRSTLSYPNETSKKCIQFLSEFSICNKIILWFLTRFKYLQFMRKFYLKFVVLTITVVRLCTMLVVMCTMLVVVCTMLVVVCTMLVVVCTMLAVVCTMLVVVCTMLVVVW